MIVPGGLRVLVKAGQGSDCDLVFSVGQTPARFVQQAQESRGPKQTIRLASEDMLHDAG